MHNYIVNVEFNIGKNKFQDTKDMVTIGKTLTGKPQRMISKSHHYFEEFIMKIEVTTIRNIPNPTIATYSRTY